eukprot:349625-Chlamydomonas_euryale.AAC.1
MVSPHGRWPRLYRCDGQSLWPVAQIVPLRWSVLMAGGPDCTAAMSSWPVAQTVPLRWSDSHVYLCRLPHSLCPHCTPTAHIPSLMPLTSEARHCTRPSSLPDSTSNFTNTPDLYL